MVSLCTQHVVLVHRAAHCLHWAGCYICQCWEGGSEVLPSVLFKLCATHGFSAAVFNFKQLDFSMFRRT